MKKLNLAFQLSTLAAMLVAGMTTYAIAQNADEDANRQKLTIDIEVIEDGEVRKITKEIDAAEGEDIHAILRELGVMEDLDISGKGERLEIKVKKEIDGDIDHDIDVRAHAPHDFRWFSEEAKEEKRPLLGVYIESYDTEGHKGALVNGVIESSAAEAAGLQEGDVITKVNDLKINSEKELRDAIVVHEVGEKVMVEYLRDGVLAAKEVTLGESNAEAFQFKRFMDEDDNVFFFDKQDLEEDFEKMMEEQDMHFNYDFDFEFDEDGAFLGVTAGEKTEGNGVVLGRVIEGTSAEKMGLQSGDRVLKMDGKAVNDFDELSKIILGKKAGDALEIEYERDGKTLTTNGELGERSEAPRPKRFYKVLPGACDQHRKDALAPLVTKEVYVQIEMKDCTKEEEAMLQEPANVDFDATLPLNKIEFAPNPNNGQFNLEFELPEKQNTRVLVFDQMGRKVYEELLNNFDGYYKNQIDISTQKNGVYYLIIAQGQKQFTRKIVKQ